MFTITAPYIFWEYIRISYIIVKLFEIFDKDELVSLMMKTKHGILFLFLVWGPSSAIFHELNCF